MDRLKLENENMAFKQKTIDLKLQLDRAHNDLNMVTAKLTAQSTELARCRVDLATALTEVKVEKAKYLAQIDNYARDRVTEILKPVAPIVVMSSMAAPERDAASYLADFKITDSNVDAKKALAIARAANPAIASTHLYNDVPVWYRRIILSELVTEAETRRRINEVFGPDELNACYRKLRS